VGDGRVAADPDAAGDASATGQYGVAGPLPPTDTSNPDVAKYVADIAKYQPNTPMDELSENAWAAVMVIASVAKTLPNYDSQTVLTALASSAA